MAFEQDFDFLAPLLAGVGLFTPGRKTPKITGDFRDEYLGDIKSILSDMWRKGSDKDFLMAPKYNVSYDPLGPNAFGNYQARPYNPANEFDSLAEALNPIINMRPGFAVGPSTIRHELTHFFDDLMDAKRRDQVGDWRSEPLFDLFSDYDRNLGVGYFSSPFEIKARYMEYDRNRPFTMDLSTEDFDYSPDANSPMFSAIHRAIRNTAAIPRSETLNRTADLMHTPSFIDNLKEALSKTEPRNRPGAVTYQGFKVPEVFDPINRLRNWFR